MQSGCSIKLALTTFDAVFLCSLCLFFLETIADRQHEWDCAACVCKSKRLYYRLVYTVDYTIQTIIILLIQSIQTILVYILYSLHKMDLYQHINRVYHRCDQCLWLWICALSENLTHKDYICRGHVNCLVLRCHLLHILAEFCQYTLTDIMIHACDMSLLSRARCKW